MPAANQGVGMNMGFPDVCTTPAAPAPIPIPYPNIGMNAMGMPFVPNVLVSMAPAQNMGTKPMLTNGDNAGVAHPMFMQPGGTIMGNPMVLIGGMPASHLTNPSYGNNFNNPVGSKLVPSVTNVLLACAATASPAAALLHGERSSAARRGDVLQLRVPCLTRHTDRWLGEALAELCSPDVAAIALDLRGNPGGLVTTALAMQARLVRLGLPVAVAADRHTASAAELLIAGLRDAGVARVFGERTFGKGRVQPFWLTPSTLFAAGTAREVLRPDGARLDGVGIAPDHACRADAALDAAVRWLRRLPHPRRAS
ncbi:MAG: PAAR-like domain-containing protein [Planctomycetota bacterium]